MALMEYNPIGKDIKTPMENTFMVESPNRKRHIFERLLFEVVIVMVKDKKIQHKTYNVNQNWCYVLHEIFKKEYFMVSFYRWGSTTSRL